MIWEVRLSLASFLFPPRASSSTTLHESSFHTYFETAAI